MEDESDNEPLRDEEEYEENDEHTTTAEEIKAAKSKELARMVEFGLCGVVPLSSAQGKRSIFTKWVVVRRGGGLVACREFQHCKKRDDLFAPGTTTITMRLMKLMACRKRLRTLTGDISNAFFHAPEHEEVYYQPPDEWCEENPEMFGMVWRGLKQLYGRKKATKNFAKFMAGALKEKRSMSQCAAAPHVFRCAAGGIMLELRVDDAAHVNDFTSGAH